MELYGIVDDTLNDVSNVATKDYRRLCKKILGLKTHKYFRHLEGLTNSFLKFKELLCTPYKNFKGRYGLYAFDILAEDIYLDENKWVWVKDSTEYDFHLPCPTFSHFLEFISGVIEYARNNGQLTFIAIKTDAEKKKQISKVSLEFRKGVGSSASYGIPISKKPGNPPIQDILIDLFDDMKLILENGLQRPTKRNAGNLTKSYLDFALVCSSISKDIKAKRFPVPEKKGDDIKSIGIEIVSEESPKNMIICLDIKEIDNAQYIQYLHCEWKDKS